MLKLKKKNKVHLKLLNDSNKDFRAEPITNLFIISSCFAH